MKKNRKLIIASDLDGTIIDHTDNKIEVARKYGYDLSARDSASQAMEHAITQEDYRNILSEIYGKLSRHAIYMPGVYAAITQLDKRFGPVRIISRRSDRERGRDYARSWIRQHLIPPLKEENLFFVDIDEEKDEIAKKFDVNVYIDDREDTLDKMPSVQHRFLFYPDENEDIICKYPIVRTWEEFLTICESL